MELNRYLMTSDESGNFFYKAWTGVVLDPLLLESREENECNQSHNLSCFKKRIGVLLVFYMGQIRL